MTTLPGRIWQHAWRNADTLFGSTYTIDTGGTMTRQDALDAARQWAASGPSPRVGWYAIDALCAAVPGIDTATEAEIGDIIRAGIVEAVRSDREWTVGGGA